jgi:hypothetical protein
MDSLGYSPGIFSNVVGERKLCIFGLLALIRPDETIAHDHDA